MNCPTCGAQNDADARFCGECGTPLENPDVEATIIGQKFELPDELDFGDNDMTIMSTPARLAEEAKTLAVDQDAMAAAMEDIAPPAPSLTDSARAAMLPPSLPEDAPPGVPPVMGSPEPAETPPPVIEEKKGGSSKKILLTVGGILLFFIILCCCCSMAMGASIVSDPNFMEDLMRELSSIELQQAELLLA